MGIAAVVEAAAAALEIEASAATLAAVTAGVRMVATVAVASIVTRAISPNQPGAGNAGVSSVRPGTRIQLPPGTNNKIPMVYGTAWVKGIITDAVISDDNQTMWYVMAFSEYSNNLPTVNFNRIYWGDKHIILNGSSALNLTASDGTVDEKIAGKIKVYTFVNGSDMPTNDSLAAWDIIPGWDTTKKMNNLIFAIVEMHYDSNAGITSIPDISVELSTPDVTPGYVISDYMQNTRYGMGLPGYQIDFDSLDALDTYSNQTIFYTDKNGDTQSAPRYRINGPVDTTQNFLTNLQAMTDSCDSWVTWNEAKGVWSITMNKAYADYTPQRISEDQILGGIDIHPVDINSTFNSVEVQFPNTFLKDQSSYFTYNLSDFPFWASQRSPYEHDNQLKIQLQFTNNQVEAQYIAARRLLTSRNNTSVVFDMTFQGLRIDAGDVIGIDHDKYGWGKYSNNTTEQGTGKLFRVQQVAETIDPNGNLYVKIVAVTYDGSLYLDSNIQLEQTEPPTMTGLADPSFLPQPGAPSIVLVNSRDLVPNFTVQSLTPGGGITQAMEFWYNTQNTTTNMIQWATEYPSFGSQFGQSSTVTSLVTAFTSGTYYWSVRAVGPRTKSPFSNLSTVTNWVPNPVATVTGQVFQAVFQPSTFSVQVDRQGTFYFDNIAPKLVASLGNSASTFVEAQADNDPRFSTGTWRIGLTTSTGNVDIFPDGITINKTASASSTATGAWAWLPAPTAMSKQTALLNVPIRYKDALGAVYSGGTAVCSFGQVFAGSSGTNAVTVFGYVECTFDPTGSPSNSSLTDAWKNTYNREPINLDGASFYQVTGTDHTKVLDGNSSPIHKFWTYYDGSTGQSIGWSAAVAEFPGDVISTGTIRANALVANAFYGKSFQSLNATLNVNTSPGAWIDGTTGNARFGGSVNIGDNLTVGGLITASALNTSTVDTGQVVQNAISDGVSVQTFNSDVNYYGSGQNYFYPNWVNVTDTALTLYNSEANTSYYIFATINSYLNIRPIYDETVTFWYRIRRIHNSTITPILTQQVGVVFPASPSSFYKGGYTAVFPGIKDTITYTGYVYYSIDIAVNIPNYPTVDGLSAFAASDRSMLVQTIKR